MAKISIGKIKRMKGKEKIAMLTAYDFPTAKFLDEAGIDIILVGDSLANAILGYENTTKVSIGEMLHHSKAVARAKPNALVVGDMPIHSYDNPKDAVENAKRFLQVGCDAVKVEGNVGEIVKALSEQGIGVMGHVGLTPQTIQEYRVQGKEEKEAERIMQEAIALSKAGCFSLVIECVSESLGRRITESVSCPTIGIGAGAFCDGQVLVINDILGLVADDFKPKFVKRYADLKKEIIGAVSKFKKEVKEGSYPSDEFSYK